MDKLPAVQDLHALGVAFVAGVCALRDRLRPAVRLAILSNSTGLYFPQIRETLTIFDLPVMKLDAGDTTTLACINHPAVGVKLEGILAGLRGIPGLVIQSVLLDGRVTNARGEAFEAWLSALAQLEPDEVQIYSTDRPVPEVGVEKVPPAMLQCIAREVERRTGLRARAYWAWS